MKGDIFDGFSHSAIQLNNWWSKMDVEDCVFRNEMHGTSWFGGGAFLSNGSTAMDTSKFINNTFYCNNSYLWSIRGYDKYALFEHNTIVYGTVNPFLMARANNMVIKNNIFYAAHAMGGNPDHTINGWFNNIDTSSSSIIRVWADDSTSYWSKLWDFAIPGPESYVNDARGVTAEMLSPANRVYKIEKNDFFMPEKLLNFYKTWNDTVTTTDSVDVPVYGQPDEQKVVLKRILNTATWENHYCKYVLDTLLSGVANVTNDNVMNEDPGFNSDVQTQLDSLILYVWKISAGQLDHPWFYNPTGSLYPPTWPLSEDLAYTNTSMQSAGTDGFALGDLNWFPAQKAQWEQYITDVNDTKPTAPTKFALSQNYPNPFNPTTRITFTLEKSGFAQLSVYNILGQKVATLLSGNLSAGQHEVNFNASNLSTGVYIYKLESGNNTSIKKMMLLK